MWSLAFGVIALAVVAFVVAYAALHAPAFTSVGLVDQLYSAKLKAFAAVKAGARTNDTSVFNASIDVVYYRVVDINGTSIALPYAYRASGVGKNVRYEVLAGVSAHKRMAVRGGEPVVVVELTLAHFIEMPWLEVYALAPTNRSALLQHYGQLYRRTGRPPLLVVDGPDFQSARTADVGWRYFRQERAEWALVRAPDGSYRMYVAIPEECYIFEEDGVRTYAVYVVDYPLGLPLAFSTPT